MKTLVIHPKDSTTDFLKLIYSGKNWTIINDNIGKGQLFDLLKSHDRIIMMGHGTADGLIGFNWFIINSGWVYLLREKICVCIWCYAHEFVKKYGLKGFNTNMFISEMQEAKEYSINCTEQEIEFSNFFFAHTINKHIDSVDFFEKVKKEYCTNKNPIIKYNWERIYNN